MEGKDRQQVLNRLRAERRWRLDELRLTQEAARLLEVRQEIRLLEKEILKYEAEELVSISNPGTIH